MYASFFFLLRWHKTTICKCTFIYNNQSSTWKQNLWHFWRLDIYTTPTFFLVRSGMIIQGNSGLTYIVERRGASIVGRRGLLWWWRRWGAIRQALPFYLGGATEWWLDVHSPTPQETLFEPVLVVPANKLAAPLWVQNVVTGRTKRTRPPVLGKRVFCRHCIMFEPTLTSDHILITPL